MPRYPYWFIALPHEPESWNGSCSPIANALQPGRLGSPPCWQHQAHHVDEPVDGRAVAVQMHSAGGVDREGHDSEVDARREAAVEADFLHAVAMAGVDRAEVEKRSVDGLLEFVRIAIGEEDPRHVGFDRFDMRGAVGVRLGRAQERDLGIKRHYGFGL